MSELTNLVQNHVQRGGRIESQTDHMAVIVHPAKNRPNKAAHAVLALLTFGLWLPFWALQELIAGQDRRFMLTVDETGTVREQDVTEPRGLYGKRKAKKRRQASRPSQ